MSETPAIAVRIDELVLHGFRPGDRYAIAEAVERELAVLLAEGGEPRESARSGREMPSFEVAADAPPEVVGKQVALVLHQHLATELR